MANADAAGLEGPGAMSAPHAVLTSLLKNAGLAPMVSRDPVHVWAMSSVERITLADDTTVILKGGDLPFANEAEVLRWADRHAVPVPRVVKSTRLASGRLVMLLEDLGEMPEQAAPLTTGATAAVQVHQCPPLRRLPMLDGGALASLPGSALDSLDTLQRAGRWADTRDVHNSLDRLADVAQDRAQGARTQPFGLCHGEFHPTSIHTGAGEPRILDWARAFIGPGLLDLASWQDTPEPLDTSKIAEMITAYVHAGGDNAATQQRGGLAAEVWAGGWHRMWIVNWYLQQCVRWISVPELDGAVQRTVRRHLTEALECLA